jgi:hypothetical protein
VTDNYSSVFKKVNILVTTNLGGIGLMARARACMFERQVVAARVCGRRRTSGGSPVTAGIVRDGGGSASETASTSSTYIGEEIRLFDLFDFVFDYLIVHRKSHV